MSPNASSYSAGIPEPDPLAEPGYWDDQVVARRRRRLGLDHGLDTLRAMATKRGADPDRAIEEYEAFAREQGEEDLSTLAAFWRVREAREAEAFAASRLVQLRVAIAPWAARAPRPGTIRWGPLSAAFRRIPGHTQAERRC